MEFKKYKRTNHAELRPVTNVEIATGKVEGVSISDVDRENGSPKVGDMIGRNPENHNDKWLISADYAAANFAELDGEDPYPTLLKLLRDAIVEKLDTMTLKNVTEPVSIKVSPKFIEHVRTELKKHYTS